MNRVLVILFVGVFFLVPATSWSAPPFDTMNLADRVAKLEALVATLRAQLGAETAARTAGDAYSLEKAKDYTDAQILTIDSLVTGLNEYVSVDTTNHRITFTGVNIQLVNGLGATPSVNGLGNFIIGYDEPRSLGIEVCSLGWYQNQTDCQSAGFVWNLNHKSGSHNMVIGYGHNYSQYSGLVVGEMNTINGFGSSVTGGVSNTASGDRSSVSGGGSNTASGENSSVSGGYLNTASGQTSSVIGGDWNVAGGSISSMSGGSHNAASGSRSSVSGGDSNQAKTDFSVVSGGFGLETTSMYEHVP